MGELRLRGKTWWIRYYRNGRRFEESARTPKKTEAERLLKLREGDIAKGIPVSPKIGRFTFDEAVVDLLNDYTLNRRRSKDLTEKRLAKHMTPVFGGRRMTTLTTTDVRAYSTKRLEAGASHGSINRELSALKRMFTLATQAGKLLTRPHIPMLRERNARTGFFEADMMAAVCAALPAVLADVVTFAWRTGWRVDSEVLTLQWAQVDMQAGIVRLEPDTTKNDEGRVFPFDLLPEVRDVLTRRAAARDDMKTAGTITPFVFHRNGRPIVSFRKAWARATEQAGCPGRIPHDLRRTAVRNLVRAGVPEKTAMMLTGHKTRSVFDRYDIVNEADLSEAVRKLADSVTGTKEGQSTESPKVQRFKRSA